MLDWKWQTVVIAASGPSQNAEDLEFVRGKAKVLAINETWRLAPWADALYACDARWWESAGPTEMQFSGKRFVGIGSARGCVSCNVEKNVNDMPLEGRRLGHGGHSGFQAVNLAAMSGARWIVLTGFDLRCDGKAHWHEDHGGEMSNPTDGFLRRCAVLLDDMAPHLRRNGVQVINATVGSSLRAYPFATVQEFLGA